MVEYQGYAYCFTLLSNSENFIFTFASLIKTLIIILDARQIAEQCSNKDNPEGKYNISNKVNLKGGHVSLEIYQEQRFKRREQVLVRRKWLPEVWKTSKQNSVQ